MKKYILIVAAFFTAGMYGCKKDYLSLETNPNTPSVSTPALSLSAALNASASIIVNDYSGYGIWAGYWTTSGNYVPNQTINQYQLTNTSMNGDWNDWYSNLTNYNVIQNLAIKNPSLSNYQAISMIMKAYGFQHLVDNFNDVPYSQAFQASSILFPAYDKGQDIYADLFKQLDAAIALIKRGGGAAVGPEDIVFGGNMNGWLEFANTLKLRMAIRVSAVSGFDPKSIMATTASAADAAGTETNFLGENVSAVANPGYSNVAGKQNPFWANYGFDPTGNPTFGNVYYRANSFSVNLLKSFNDPRVSELYAPITGAWPSVVIRGNTFGDVTASNEANPGSSAIGPGLLQSPSQGAILMSGAESLFLQAEAVVQGYLTGDAQSLYQGGITAHFVEVQAGGTYTPVPADGQGNPISSSQTLQTTDFTYTPPSAATSAALAATYYNQAITNVGWAASADKLQAIHTQKWIALNGYFNMEGWNEYRRTLTPNLPTSADPAKINPTLPTRVLYPLSEITTNSANLAKEGTINIFTSKIFWAK